MKFFIIFFVFPIFVYAQSYQNNQIQSNSIDSISLSLVTETSELFIKIDGKNNKEVIILLHGGPGVPDYLEEVSNILKNHFKVVRFDQRGVGRSKSFKSDYSIKNYISDLNSIIDYLQISKVHLFGHSWGGLLAQIYTVNNPERIKSLFLCSPSSGSGKIWSQMEKEVFAYNKNQSTSIEWMSMGINSLFGIMGFDFGYRSIFSNVWRYYFKEPKSISPPNNEWLDGIKAEAINKTREEIIHYDNSDLDNFFDSIKIPVILTYGKYDIYGSSKTESIKRLKSNNLYEFENAGHLPWIQDNLEFKKKLSQFYKY